MPEPLTAKQIDKYCTELKAKIRCYEENDAYVMGKNPTIIKEKDKPEPDNRIPVPLAKAAVMSVMGYAGRPGDITTNYQKIDAEDQEEEEDDYQKVINEISGYNEEDIENSELLSEGLTQGKSFELWWITQDLKLDGGIPTPEYIRVPISESFPVYTDSLKPKMEAFIRYWKRDKDLIADVYYPFRSERWVKDGSTQLFTRDEDGDSEYPYSTVPAIEFSINPTKTPLFQAEKRLIDAYDSGISKSQNEIDRFNALIMLMPGGVSAEFKQKLAEAIEPILDNLADFEKWPEYLQKDLTGVSEFTQNMLVNLERLFHKTIGIPDISDENFAGNQSGVAIAYKLIPLEFLLAQVEPYFRKGLIKRKSLIDDVLGIGLKNYDSESYKPVVGWKRNIPVDEKAKAEIALLLSALLSDETVLENLPNTIVPDVKAELERIGNQIEPLDDADTTDAIGE